MTCLGPLPPETQAEMARELIATARAAREASERRWRRRARVLAAGALLALVLVPAALKPSMRAQEAVPDGVADMGDDDAMLTAGRLPAKFPEDWRKPPCPTGKGLTKERGACFLVLDAKPPCDVGYDDGKGRCLFPMAERKDAPRSISR